METLLAFFGGTAGSWLLGILGFAGINVLADKFLSGYVTDEWLESVREWIANFIQKPGEWIGLAITKAGTSAPFVGKIWNKTVEPFVIIILRTIVGGIVEGLMRLIERIITFMQSDNPSTKE